jgi:YVTN family beta-propeller protein
VWWAGATAHTVLHGGRAAVERGIGAVEQRPGRGYVLAATPQQIEIRLLGVVEASLDGRPIALGAAKQRAVLAMLALRANERVSSDRLIEGLWGEVSPPSAAKMVQLYVSQLRKLLNGDGGEILTRGRGYELRLPADAVDALRFERLVTDAARAGAPPTMLVREALVLWRGSPLDDIADEPFAAAEIRRLEEVWLRARELAVDAALAAGEHLAVLGELEALVAEHPLRERLHAQRMLALYRCGRQAEALEAYRDARRRLLDEVGVEPGTELRELHEAVLRQDPALDPPAGARRAASARAARRPHAVIAGALLAAVAAAAVVVLLVAGGDEQVVVPAEGVAIIDPGSNRVDAAIALAQGPGPIAAADGRVWTLNLGNATLSQIDARTRKLVETVGTGGDHPAGNLVATHGNVWIAEGCSDGSSGALTRIDTTLRPISAREGGPILFDTAGKARAVGSVQSSPGCGLAAAGRSVWLTSYTPPGIARLDVEGDSPTATVARVRARQFLTSALAVGAGWLWVRDMRRDAIQRTDPRTLAVQQVIQTGSDPAAIAVGAGAVWVANSGDGSVSRIDLRSNAVTRAISVGNMPVALALGERAVWVANAGDGTVSRIDPSTAKVVATVHVGHRPQGVAVAGGAVWVTVRR